MSVWRWIRKYPLVGIAIPLIVSLGAFFGGNLYRRRGKQPAVRGIQEGQVSVWRWFREYPVVGIATLVIAFLGVFFGNDLYSPLFKQPALAYQIGQPVPCIAEPTLCVRSVVIHNYGKGPAHEVRLDIGPGVTLRGLRPQGFVGSTEKLAPTPEGHIQGPVGDWPPNGELTVHFYCKIDGDPKVVVTDAKGTSAIPVESLINRRSSLNAFCFAGIIVVVLILAGVIGVIISKARCSTYDAEAKVALATQAADQARKDADRAKAEAHSTGEQAQRACEATKRADQALSFYFELQFWLDKLADASEQLLALCPDVRNMQEYRSQLDDVDRTAARIYDTCLAFCQKLLSPVANQVTGCVLAIRGHDFIARAHQPGLGNRCMREFQRSIDVGVEGWARETGRIQYCDNLEQERGRYQDNNCLDFIAKSEIVIPIVVGDNRSVGVICLYGSNPIPVEVIKNLEIIFDRLGQILGIAALLDPYWATTQ